MISPRTKKEEKKVSNEEFGDEGWMQAVNVEEDSSHVEKNNLIETIDSIIKSLLYENPDHVLDRKTHWNELNTIVFIGYKHRDTGEIKFGYIDTRGTGLRGTTHGRVEQKYDLEFGRDYFDIIRGRLWPDKKLGAFWQIVDVIDPYRSEIESFLGELGLNANDFKWDYIGNTELVPWKKSSKQDTSDNIEIPPDIQKKILQLLSKIHTSAPDEKRRIEKEIDDLYKQAGVANRKEREKLAYIAATSKKMVPFEKGGGGSVAGYKYAKGMPAIAEDKVKIYNKTLCPKLWDENKKLNPEVRDTLLKIAFDFYSDSDLRIPIQDVYLLGSSANYNWSPTGDLDVHILLDVATLSMHPENAEKFLHTLTGKWNLEHDIKVKGHRVELYLQDIREENKSTAVYSLVQDQWIKEPNPEKISLDKDLIQKKYSLWVQKINDAIKREDEKALKNILEALKDYRQCGLDKQGEFSPENLVFKILRAKGFLKKIKDGYNQLYDKKMTVKETGTYMSYGHQKGGVMWGYNKTGEFKKKVSKDSCETHNDTPGFSRMEYQGRYDPARNIITIVDMSNWWADKLNTDVESLPEDLIRRLKFEFGDTARIKRFHEGKDINDGFDPTSMGPNPEATEGQIDNGSFYSGHIRKMRQLEEAKVKDLKSTYPKLDFDWEGNIPFDKLSMDNLVSMKKKIGRFYRDAADDRHIDDMQAWSRIYLEIDNELKRRLKYINRPIKEESGNQDIKGKYFTIKFNDPRVSKGAGIILFGDEWFANAIRMPSGYGRFENKWVINRHTGAFRMGLEAEEIGFDKVEDLLKYLDEWYEKNKPSQIKETDYYKDEDEDDEDAKYAEAERYFSIGQEDEETMAKSYCWIWDNRTQSILAKKGGTHSINFGYGRKDNTFSGWYDPEKNAISIVFPDHEREKLGGRKPTEDDIPQPVYSKLISKFGKRKPRFFVFEGYGAGISEEDRLHIQGHRWQIRSKDAPKTPKISEEMEMLVNEILDKIIPINEFVKSKLPVIGRLTKDFNIKAMQAKNSGETHGRTVGWRDDDLMWRYRSDLNVFYYWGEPPSDKQKFVLILWANKHFGNDLQEPRFVHVESSNDIYQQAHGVSESLLMKSPNQI